MGRHHDEEFIHVPDNPWAYEEFCVDGEEFYRIKSHPDYYVNCKGDIISLHNQLRPRYLKPWETKHGHKVVGLDGERVYVHRVVAETLIPNLHNDPIVRHLDDDPANNDYLNLSWGSQKDNVEDCRRNEHDYRKGVYCYENGRVYRSCVEAANDIGVSKSAITVCCQGKIGSVKGYHLCYEDSMGE